MRLALILLAALLLPTSASSWGIGMCTKIEWQSFKRIECTKVESDEGAIFVIVYSRGALAMVESRGAREGLLVALCDEGAYMVREIDGSTSYVHMCK